MADHELLQADAVDEGPHRRIAHRQHGGGQADARAELSQRLRGAHALPQQPCPLDAPCKIAVAEVEPDLVAKLTQAVHHLEGVLGKSPAPLVDQVGQPEGDQIGVRGDACAVDLDVIAGIRDHRQSLRADHVKHAARQLGPASAAGQHDHAATLRSRACGAQSHSESGRPVNLTPACAL